MSKTSIALTRFGLGATRDAVPPADPQGWLVAQFDRFEPRPGPIAGVSSSAVISRQLFEHATRQRELRRANAARMEGAEPATPQATGRDLLRELNQEAGRNARAEYFAAVGARVNSALETQAPFVERLVHFWANHFAVSAEKLEVIGLAGSLEFEAIRPHVLGRFGDMLAAVERHPAMLIYLDQALSVGPASIVGQRIAAEGKRRVGINENLAREILELHTVGVGSGYTQADVTELARALTGWSVSGISRRPGARLDGSEGPPGAFFFAAKVHEPGDRTVLGKRYPEGGEAQAAAVLADLAVQPATAAFLATKLARHFAGDAPPKPMVERLKRAYLQSGGNLPTVYQAILSSPEAWNAKPTKFKTPWQWTISSYRALGIRNVQPRSVAGLLEQLGQPVWKPGSPAGYADTAANWAGPDALMRRVEAAERLAARSPGVDGRILAKRLFPSSLSPATAEALDRAESPSQALALLLVSPEMMRR
ncbi:DUF1800 domain-containing protein [Sphingomonas sp. 3-13AW]|uniref:DUF1800 domain-containing protein n=1 Tax=Sphingomonas sp. 3-13AW TaxID=3050450 RepID=UPI003BB6EFA3